MRMRTAIALLVNDDFANKLTPFTLRCWDYGFNLRVLRLPAHVSLKQPFVVIDFKQLEKYFEKFANQISPQKLRFDGFVFWGDASHGLVVARVKKSTRLRQLHAQLNIELEQEFGETRADHDGADYEFHLTIAIGESDADLLSQLRADVPTWKLDEITVSSRIAMFIYDESSRPDSLYGVREYGTYKILPL